MSKYLVRHVGFGVLCKPPRPGMLSYWEHVLTISQLAHPWLVGVMTWDTYAGAQKSAETNGGIAIPVTEVFDDAVILSPP